MWISCRRRELWTRQKVRCSEKLSRKPTRRHHDVRVYIYIIYIRMLREARLPSSRCIRNFLAYVAYIFWWFNCCVALFFLSYTLFFLFAATSSVSRDSWIFGGEKKCGPRGRKSHKCRGICGEAKTYISCFALAHHCTCSLFFSGFGCNKMETKIGMYTTAMKQGKSHTNDVN